MICILLIKRAVDKHTEHFFTLINSFDLNVLPELKLPFEATNRMFTSKLIHLKTNSIIATLRILKSKMKFITEK